MSRLVRSALLAFVLLVLSAAPGPTAVAEASVTASAVELTDPSSQLSSGLPVARSSATTSIGNRGVTCSRPDVFVQLVLFAVLPTPTGAGPLEFSESVAAPGETLAGTAASCATGRAPPTAR